MDAEPRELGSTPAGSVCGVRSCPLPGSTLPMFPSLHQPQSLLAAPMPTMFQPLAGALTVASYSQTSQGSSLSPHRSVLRS